MAVVSSSTGSIASASRRSKVGLEVIVFDDIVLEPRFRDLDGADHDWFSGNISRHVLVSPVVSVEGQGREIKNVWLWWR